MRQSSNEAIKQSSNQAMKQSRNNGGTIARMTGAITEVKSISHPFCLCFCLCCLTPLWLLGRLPRADHQQSTHEVLMSREVFVYEAIRTPRGRGKKDGSLCEVKPINLLAGLLRELKERTALDTTQVDDAVIGCVTPIQDQGMNIGKTALLVADWSESVPGF